MCCQVSVTFVFVRCRTNLSSWPLSSSSRVSTNQRLTRHPCLSSTTKRHQRQHRMCQVLLDWEREVLLAKVPRRCWVGGRTRVLTTAATRRRWLLRSQPLFSLVFFVWFVVQLLFCMFYDCSRVINIVSVNLRLLPYSSCFFYVCTLTHVVVWTSIFVVQPLECFVFFRLCFSWKQ